MTLAWAYEHLVNGQRLTRAAWPSNQYVWISSRCNDHEMVLVAEDGKSTALNGADVMADDWRLYGTDTLDMDCVAKLLERHVCLNKENLVGPCQCLHCELSRWVEGTEVYVNGVPSSALDPRDG